MPPPMVKRVAIMRANPKVISDTTSATCLAALAPVKISTTAPTAGSNARMVSHGIVISPLSSAQPTQQDHQTDDRNTNRHSECVRADEAILHSPQPCRHPTNCRRRAVHGAIDTRTLQPNEPRGEPLAGSHEHRLIEGVAIQIIASGHCKEGGVRGLGDRDLAARPEDPH